MKVGDLLSKALAPLTHPSFPVAQVTAQKVGAGLSELAQKLLEGPRSLCHLTRGFHQLLQTASASRGHSSLGSHSLAAHVCQAGPHALGLHHTPSSQACHQGATAGAAAGLPYV